MLTYNDVTRKDAVEVYKGIRDITELKFVGFKNIGLDMDEYKKLVQMMKEDGKTIFLEVVSDSEEESVKSGKVGLELGVDCLIGTMKPYINASMNYIKGKPIKFMPYIGDVVDHPCILRGTIEEMQNDAKEVEAKGVDGINLLAYRHATVNVEILIKNVMEVMKTPLIVAGSIKTPEQVKKMDELNVWAFTIGGAIFDKKFVQNGSYADNIKAVLEIIK
jgi:putative N-acetylmannosamine-6-phosphate epimerase